MGESALSGSDTFTGISVLGIVGCIGGVIICIVDMVQTPRWVEKDR